MLRTDGTVGCVFCGRRPLTNEHALPSWLAGPLGVGADERVTHAYSGPPQSPEPSWGWTAVGLDLKAKAVCRPCNEGWMNELEGDVRPFLGPMIEGRQRRLSAADCERLTAWLLKTVLMVQLAEPKARRLVRQELYAELYEQRTPGLRLQGWAAGNTFPAGVACATRGIDLQRGERPTENTWAHALVLRCVTLVLVDLGVGSARPILVEPPLVDALLPLWADPVGGTFPPRLGLGREHQPLILHLLAHSAR